MIEITWQYDPERMARETSPHTPEEAQQMLELGNAAFAALGEQAGDAKLVLRAVAEDLGLPAKDGQSIQQTPFAAMLSCADARVPTELIFGQQANDLFVVRVAGNVLGAECLGSIDYAITHMDTIHLVTVLGHTGCGAVTAAVDAYLSTDLYLEVAANPALRGIIDSMMAAVRLSAATLARAHGDAAAGMLGYKPALVELTVALHAAMTGTVLQRTCHQHAGQALGAAFAVYNIGNRKAGLPLDEGGDEAGWRAGLYAPPANAATLTQLAREMAGGRFITTLLNLTPSTPLHHETH
jgi:carbonic anhydrase